MFSIRLKGSQGPRRRKADTDTGDSDSVAKINEMLEMFIGISDSELGKFAPLGDFSKGYFYCGFGSLLSATRLYELAVKSKTKVEFVDAVDSSELECFSFSDDFLSKVFDICHHV